MKVTTGIDIVHIPTFNRSLEQGGESFLERVYTPAERNKTSSVERLAGFFAAKEAVVKALGLKTANWQTIEINHELSGKPTVSIADSTHCSGDISIAHHGEYAVASAVFIFE